MLSLLAFELILGQLVFKYHFQHQCPMRLWVEMNLWMRLPRHPSIVPFARVVVDELEGRVIGFTSSYVPGGTLQDNQSRVFKIAWLHQLINVVDELNLRYGVAHQDIAPRNLVVDESTDSIMLFDFNYAARIDHVSTPGGGEYYHETRNDVKGVIFTTYEIITRDTSLREKPAEEQNLEDLEREWVKHPETKLDHPVASYRLVLQAWQERRAGVLDTVRSSGFPEAIDRPPRPEPPLKTISTWTMDMQPSSYTVEAWFERRQELLERGDKVLNWERPPQSVIDKGTRVLSTGQVINC
jgi:hypothetical protein